LSSDPSLFYFIQISDHVHLSFFLKKKKERKKEQQIEKPSLSLLLGPVPLTYAPFSGISIWKKLRDVLGFLLNMSGIDNNPGTQKVFPSSGPQFEEGYPVTFQPQNCIQSTKTQLTRLRGRHQSKHLLIGVST
jgi:hypothetical protein